MKDKELVKKLKAGNETAYNQLVADVEPGLRSYANYLARYNRSMVDDLIQDTFLALLEGLDRFEGRSTLKTYLFRILYYQFQKKIRKEKREIKTGEIEDIIQAQFAESGRWKNPNISWPKNPAELYDQQEVKDVINKGIAELPEKYGQVIFLRDLKELSSEEVCNILEITDTNLRVRLHRARLYLKDIIEGYFEEKRVKKP